MICAFNGIREGNVYDYLLMAGPKSLSFAAFHGVGVERKWFLVCVYIYFVLHVKSWRLDRRIDKELSTFFQKSIFSLLSIYGNPLGTIKMHSSLAKEEVSAESCGLKHSLWTLFFIHKQLCILKAVSLPVCSLREPVFRLPQFLPNSQAQPLSI